MLNLRGVVRDDDLSDFREVAGAGMRRPGRTTSSGTSSAQMSCAFQQRVRNRHPDGGFAGLGTSRFQHDLVALTAQRRVGHRHRRQQACVYG